MEHLLVDVQRIALDGGGDGCAIRSFDVTRIVAQPLLIRLAALEFVVDIFRVQHFTRRRIDNEYLTGADSTFSGHILWLVVVSTHFRSKRNEPIISRHPSSGAKTVPIQQTTRVATIC